MSAPEGDRDLRAAFEALRREEARGAPPLGATLARARAQAQTGRGPVVAWRLVAVAGGAVLAAGLWIFGPTGEPRPERAQDLARELGTSVGSLRAATDVLLETPGHEILGATPASLMPLPAPGPERRSDIHGRILT